MDNIILALRQKKKKKIEIFEIVVEKNDGEGKSS